LETTKIGLGLAAIGRPEYINLRQEPDPDKSLMSYRNRALELLDAAYKRGIRHFDTAPSYGKGEDFLIEWYRKSHVKDAVFSTKWGYTYVANWEIGYQGKHEIKEHSLGKLNEQWQKSKDLMPALNIYQVHSATFESGVLDNTEVLRRLHEIKIKHGIKIGMSVSGSDQARLLDEASTILIEGKPLFDSFQVSYNILESTTHQMVGQLLSAGKTIIIKEALANGRLLPNSKLPQYNELYQVLTGLGSKYKVGADAIALRYVIDNLKPTTVLSGASSLIQLNGNLKALGFRLEEKELSQLSTYGMEAQAYWHERSELKWH